jgi:hypothetical protein
MPCSGLRPRTTIVHDAVLVGYRAIANAPLRSRGVLAARTARGTAAAEASPASGQARPACDMKPACDVKPACDTKEARLRRERSGPARMKTSGRAPLIDAGGGWGALRADRSLFGPGANPPRDRTGFFFFVRGRLLRPLVPLVAAPAERVQRPRPQCDAPNPCPVPAKTAQKTRGSRENAAESLDPPPVDRRSQRPGRGFPRSAPYPHG